MRYLGIIFISLALPITASCEEKAKDKGEQEPLVLASAPPTDVSSPSAKNDAGATTSWMAVANVAADDVLNMRAQASAQADLVLAIPADAKNILKVSESGKWVEIEYRGMRGWVRSKYVQNEPAHGLEKVFGGELLCVGTEPSWSIRSKGGILTLRHFSESQAIVLNDVLNESQNENNVWMTTASSEDLTDTYSFVFRKTNACSDGMSDDKYPFNVAHFKNQTELYSGCCKIMP